MKFLYKVQSHYITKLYLDVDYVENYNKIIFKNGKHIYKNQLDELLINVKDGFVFFTYDKNKIHKYQQQIKRTKQ